MCRKECGLETRSDDTDGFAVSGLFLYICNLKKNRKAFFHILLFSLLLYLCYMKRKLFYSKVAWNIFLFFNARRYSEHNT